MKTVLKINHLMLENTLLVLKSLGIVLIVFGFLYISYIGMSKPYHLKEKKIELKELTTVNPVPGTIHGG